MITLGGVRVLTRKHTVSTEERRGHQEGGSSSSRESLMSELNLGREDTYSNVTI